MLSQGVRYDNHVLLSFSRLDWFLKEGAGNRDFGLLCAFPLQHLQFGSQVGLYGTEGLIFIASQSPSRC